MVSTTNAGPASHLPLPSTEALAVGKVIVGPTPQIILPGFAGERNTAGVGNQRAEEIPASYLFDNKNSRCRLRRNRTPGLKMSERRMSSSNADQGDLDVVGHCRGTMAFPGLRSAEWTPGYLGS
jgi:hypothetical protein